MLLIHPFRQLYLLLLFLLLLLPAYTQAAVTAQVDKYTFYQGQKITLVLESDRKVDRRPDLSPLHENFRVLGTKKVTISKHSTGSVETRTSWELRLRALNEGNIQIPPLQLGEELSQELILNVLPAAQNPTPEESGLRPIFLEVEFDKDELYVNSQAILRAKIFHLAPLPLDSQLSEITAINALVKPLEQRKEYRTQVQGQNYFTTEYSYTIFPRAEGTLEVEPVFFTATMPGGEILELNSSLFLLNVLPKAKTSNPDIWLPAESIYIEDNLASSITASQDETIRRIITLEAMGFPASNLPRLADLNNAKADIKLINVVLEEQMTEKGIISQRMEELLITPLVSGEITLPAITLPWWNTRQETTQNATIPERVINATLSSLATVPETAPEKTTNSDEHGNQELLIWLLTLIAVVATTASIYAVNKLRQLQPSEPDENEILEREQEIQRQASDVAERNTFKALTMACNQNNPEIAQLRLVEWAQSFWNDYTMGTLEEVCEYANNQTLNFLVLDLEQHLYSDNAHLWQGDLLIEAIEKIRNRRQRDKLDMHPGDERLSYQV
ncbi:BatD family protein [Neptuniibacter sp.]|uniref:BatD family protein n=1 Tax=Neptuniibacter sp. TaxID=1962643 RepID=UPI002604ED53|nr:BatD family protein [Neptuniibacter sp.]MCP4597111.1 protein BatD [Neptuniibacter sp.]